MSAESLREPITLPLTDGALVRLRPIQPADAPRLQAFHSRLSPNTIYLRWLHAHPVLSDAEAAQLAQVDYVTRMAYIATTGQVPDEQIVGVARYGLVEPGAAEAAVVVEDAYQGRGLGTTLLGRLMQYAQAQGIRFWLAEINAENARMLRFINRGGFPVARHFEGGSVQVRLDIADAKPTQPDG